MIYSVWITDSNKRVLIKNVKKIISEDDLISSKAKCIESLIQNIEKDWNILCEKSDLQELFHNKENIFYILELKGDEEFNYHVLINTDGLFMDYKCLHLDFSSESPCSYLHEYLDNL